jgi:hypothetical protein
MKQQKKNDAYLIPLVMVLMLVYSVFYWMGKFHVGGDFFHAAYLQIAGHWALFTFLEFLGAASLVVDLVIRFDDFSPREQRLRIFMTALLVASFVGHAIIGMIDIYVTGQIEK